MTSVQERDEVAAEYERRFDALAKIACELSMSPEESGHLIHDILLATLVHRRALDMDVWLVATFTAAVHGREERTS